MVYRDSIIFYFCQSLSEYDVLTWITTLHEFKSKKCWLDPLTSSPSEKNYKPETLTSLYWRVDTVIFM